ncbi:MAG: sulfotransferase family protein [Thermoanaerobaculia bacterium]|nr:sulfotransferase family protein [Thermoanaerobaculia bacterium]
MLEWIRGAWRRARYGKPVVVVSGLPRSGTSMAMKMLEAGGVPLVMDGLRTADEDNPKGYFEDERVKELAEMEDKSWLRAARGRAIKVISYLLEELPRTNNYKVIFMHRRLQEVLTSQAKMLERRDEEDELSDEEMMKVFENHLWRVGYLFRRAPHLERLELAYHEVIADPRRAAEQMNEFLGGDLDVDRMAGVVDPSLYRNRAEELEGEVSASG